MNLVNNYSRKVSALKNKLTHFGLDPVDWQIKESRPGEWVIFSQNHQDLQFVGVSIRQRTSWDWKLIQLAI
jgi:hypothetical protein